MCFVLQVIEMLHTEVEPLEEGEHHPPCHIQHIRELLGSLRFNKEEFGAPLLSPPSPPVSPRASRAAACSARRLSRQPRTAAAMSTTRAVRTTAARRARTGRGDPPAAWGHGHAHPRPGTAQRLLLRSADVLAAEARGGRAGAAASDA